MVLAICAAEDTLRLDADGNDPTGKMFAQSPHEVEVPLDTTTTLIWNPTTWHATTANGATGRRRTVGWNYGRRGAGGRVRDREAVKWVFAGVWENWSEARKRLWGLDGNSAKL